MGNSLTLSKFSTAEAFHPKPIIFFLEITLTGANNPSKPLFFLWHIKLNILKISFSSEATINQQKSTNSMVFTMNVLYRIILGKRKYSLKIWKLFIDCFNTMPIAALI